MADKKSFVMYKSWIPMFEDLDDADLGILIKAVCAYQKGESVEIPRHISPIFAMMRATFEEDDERYAARCAKNSEIATAREEQKRARQTTSVHERERTCTNSTESESDSDKDIKPKKEKQEKEKAQRVIDYLNAKTGSKYRLTDSHYSKIKARFAEKYTEDDFRKAIDNKVAEWKGTEMEQYLRPDTLFGTKFDSYLNAKVNPTRAVKKTAFNSYESNHNYDFDALADILSRPPVGG